MNNGRVFQMLRQGLRSKRITYAGLGEAIGLSESGVKKVFANENCSLTRLREIADVAEIPLAELFSIAEERPAERVMLTLEQQQWLLDNLDCFAFYWKLAIEGLSVPRIKDLFGLPDERARSFVSSLDDLGLIVLEPFDRIRVPHSRFIRWEEDGPLMRFLNRTWSEKLISDCLGNLDRRDVVFRLHELRLTDSTARELRDSLQSLCDDFVRRARYEEVTHGRGMLETQRLTVASSTGGFVEQI